MDDENLEYENEDNYNNLPSYHRLNSGSSPIPKRLRDLKHGNMRNLPNKRNTGNPVPKKEENREKSLPLSEKVENNKQKNKGLLSRFRKNKEEKNDDKEEDETSSSYEENNVEEGISKIKKVKRILAISGIILPVFFMILFLLIIVASISALVGTPISSVASYGTNDFNPVSQKGTASYEKEINYNKKLKEAEEKYKNQCGKELNTDYINASLMYYYYVADIPNDINGANNSVINYDRMSDMVDIIANLMYKDSCTVDYNVNGNFYNNLKNNSSFRSYYSEILKKQSIDDILEGIFEIGKMISTKDDYVSRVYIPENTKISAPNQVKKGITGNVNAQEKTPEIKSVSFKDYLLGILYANVESKYLEDNEKVKAYVVALATNVLAKNNLSVNTSTISLTENFNTLYCNPDYGCSYVIKDKVKSLQVGGGDGGNGNNIFVGGKYYYHTKMDDNLKKNLISLINDVYGKVLSDSDDKYIEVDLRKIDNSSYTNYEEILKNAYKNLILKNIRENVYANGVNYGNVLVQTPVIFYDQADYTSSFCGIWNESIKTSGCGVTSMAIVVSTYENNKQYNPVVMSDRAQKAYSQKYCGPGSGTYEGFFYAESIFRGYKYLWVGKYKTSDLNLVTAHLREGHLVIVHVLAGTFTTGGHYMVLSGIDPDTKRVYVTDPYNRLNKQWRGSGSGWYSFNDIIVPQTYSFHIIWKG